MSSILKTKKFSKFKEGCFFRFENECKHALCNNKGKRCKQISCPHKEWKKFSLKPYKDI
jgi:hypothetical protein